MTKKTNLVNSQEYLLEGKPISYWEHLVGRCWRIQIFVVVGYILLVILSIFSSISTEAVENMPYPKIGFVRSIIIYLLAFQLVQIILVLIILNICQWALTINSLFKYGYKSMYRIYLYWILISIAIFLYFEIYLFYLFSLLPILHNVRVFYVIHNPQE